MFSISRSIALTAVLGMTTGCSIMHPVAEDYQRYLSNNQGAVRFDTVRPADQYFLPAATQNHHYEFRAATTGYANVWVMEFGKVLDATMQSTDVIKAFGGLTKATAQSQVGNTLIFNLDQYTFEDFGAHVTLTISVKNANGEIFKKTYSAKGKTQGAKMFFAGAFGMKNAIQQSTKLAMDDIITNLIRDLKTLDVVASAS